MMCCLVVGFMLSSRCHLAGEPAKAGSDLVAAVLLLLMFTPQSLAVNANFLTCFTFYTSYFPPKMCTWHLLIG